MKKSDKDLMAMIPCRDESSSMVHVIRTHESAFYMMGMRPYMRRFLAGYGLTGDDIRTRKSEKGPPLVLPGGNVFMAVLFPEGYGYLSLNHVSALEIRPGEAGFLMADGRYFRAEATVETLLVRYRSALELRQKLKFGEVHVP